MIPFFLGFLLGAFFGVCVAAVIHASGRAWRDAR